MPRGDKRRPAALHRIGKSTVSLEDFDHCELIYAMGHNPGTNHPRMVGTLHEVSRSHGR
jgi:anaerobic selenocysteine-containing dehydrogenase